MNTAVDTGLQPIVIKFNRLDTMAGLHSIKWNSFSRIAVGNSEVGIPPIGGWLWGVNGAAGVLAAGLAVACGIGFSLDVTIVIGGICYAVLLFFALPLLRMPHESRDVPADLLHGSSPAPAGSLVRPSAQTSRP